MESLTRREESGRKRLRRRKSLRLDKLRCRPLAHARAHNEGRPLHGVDGVDAVLHNSLNQALVEAVRCRQHNVQRGVLEPKGSGPGQRVNQVERPCTLASLLLRPQRPRRIWGGKKRRLRSKCPLFPRAEDGRTKSVADVKRIEPAKHTHKSKQISSGDEPSTARENKDIPRHPLAIHFSRKTRVVHSHTILLGDIGGCCTGLGGFRVLWLPPGRLNTSRLARTAAFCCRWWR
mmetsp:Transcript_19018/g.52356  ORF Transcript_19018/g.52356 Transcript_19018/m.52356 type:complete len:233 (-) Transcript_19018:401-1099(-)